MKLIIFKNSEDLVIEKKRSPNSDYRNEKVFEIIVEMVYVSD